MHPITAEDLFGPNLSIPGSINMNDRKFPGYKVTVVGFSNPDRLGTDFWRSIHRPRNLADSLPGNDHGFVATFIFLFRKIWRQGKEGGKGGLSKNTVNLRTKFQRGIRICHTCILRETFCDFNWTPFKFWHIWKILLPKSAFLSP